MADPGTLPARSFERLDPGRDLDDEILNQYLQILHLEEGTKEGTIIFDSFFFVDLQRKDLARISKRFQKQNPFEAQLIVIPLHLPAHWALIVVKPQKRRIEAYDSLGGSHGDTLHELFYTISREARLRGLDFRPEAWHLQDSPANLRKQSQSGDCGVFAAYYADCIMKGRDIDLDPASFCPTRYRLAMKSKFSPAEEVAPSPLSTSEGIIEEPVMAEDQSSMEVEEAPLASPDGPNVDALEVMLAPSPGSSISILVSDYLKMDTGSRDSWTLLSSPETPIHSHQDATPTIATLEGPSSSTNSELITHRPSSSPGPSPSTSGPPSRRRGHQPRTKKRRITLPDGRKVRIPEHLLNRYLH